MCVPHYILSLQVCLSVPSFMDKRLHVRSILYLFIGRLSVRCDFELRGGFVCARSFPLSGCEQSGVSSGQCMQMALMWK